MPASYSPWEKVLRDLHREFTLLERELSLLQDIDKSILSMGTHGNSELLKGLFLDTIDRFSEIHHAEQPVLCYVYLGSSFRLLKKQDTEVNYPEEITLSKPLRPPLDGSESGVPFALLSRDEDETLFGCFPGYETILLCPMFSELKLLISLFVIADTKAKEISRLTDPAFASSFVALISQLAIAYKHDNRALQHRKIQELWNTFLESNLSPTQCFKEIAKRVPRFLPDFGPIRLQSPDPEVQILMLSNDPDPTITAPELVIRGTTGAEPPGTRLAIHRSICGLLIESNELKLPFFCDDPTKPDYKALYREYLGKGKPIRTELAVRIVFDRHPIGVLNLESETIDAFNIHHINAVLRLAETIAPILMVFERRLEMNNTMQLSVASSTARYLEGIASVYRHSMKTPLLTLKSNIETISALVEGVTVKNLENAIELARSGDTTKILPILDRVAEKMKSTSSKFERLYSMHSQISRYNADFLKDISTYAETGPTDLRATVDATLKLVTESLLAQLGQQIELKIVADETEKTTKVYGSPLLKQHLYSIFHNSVLAVQERLREDPRIGVISISITKDLPPPSQEVQLNTSWAVSIRDNGKGVTPEQLERLRHFEPGLRFRKDQGTGSGLVTAQRFITSIGGRMELESVSGEFFEVILHIYEDRPS